MKIFTFLFSLIISITSSTAAIINVNYHTAGDEMDGTAYVDNTTSMISYTGSTWNDINTGNAASGPLNDSTGAATTVTATTTGFVNVAPNNNAVLPTLSESYAYVRDNPGTLTIGGLDASSSYDFYFAAQGDQLNQNAFISNGGTTVAPNVMTAWPVPANYGTPGDLWVQFPTTFTGVTSISFTVDHNPATRWGGLNGFQIVETPIPEPSTFAMLLLGIGAALILRRERRTVSIQ